MNYRVVCRLRGDDFALAQFARVVVDVESFERIAEWGERSRPLSLSSVLWPGAPTLMDAP